MTRSSQFRYPLPSPRQGNPADDALLELRRADEKVLRSDTELPFHRVGDVPCVVVAAERPSAVIVHVHGGGYRRGSAAGFSEFAGRLAASIGAQVILPEYSLAPEKPFPCAIHDVLSVLAAVREHEADVPIFLSGDSAGGGVALAAAIAQDDLTWLSGLILISPWIDLRLTAGSYRRCASSDAWFSHQAAAAAAKDYLQGWPDDDPLASPVLGVKSPLAPLCVLASTGEVLADDSLKLAQAAAEHDIPFTLYMQPALPHDWPILMPQARASKQALEVIASFVAQCRVRDADGSVAQH